jgi:hypothetical protein
VQQRLLLDTCVEHASDNEISGFIDFSVATGAHWAGEWAVNLIFKRRYLASITTIEAIFKCLPANGPLSQVLLRAKLYNHCGHFELAREHLRLIAVQQDADPVDLFEFASLADTFGHHDKARFAWRQAARNGYDRVACHLEIARSFVAEGCISDAVRFAPRRGALKDERCEALFALLGFLRDVFKKISAKDRKYFDSMFGTDEGIKRVVQNLPLDVNSKPETAILVSALAIVLALRAPSESSAQTWGIALEWSIRAALPAQQIDAIISLSAPSYGGEPLRVAAVALGSHPGAAVLARWHKIADKKETRSFSRRREDFVAKHT